MRVFYYVILPLSLSFPAIFCALITSKVSFSFFLTSIFVFFTLTIAFLIFTIILVLTFIFLPMIFFLTIVQIFPSIFLLKTIDAAS